MCGCMRAAREQQATRGELTTHDDATARNGGLDERVQLLIAADGQLQVARGDALHLNLDCETGQVG